MKKYILILLISSVNFLFAQESMLDIVAERTCNYLESDELKNLSVTQRQQKLGLFIINVYNENEEKFNAEGIEIDFSDGENSGRAFGEKVGMNMVKFCPEVLIALAGETEVNTTSNGESEAEETYAIKGKIVKVVGEEFSSVVLKDEQGKSQKFLWLQNFSGSDQLIDGNFNSNNSPKVELTYKNMECYSPKLNDYIIRKVIVEINFIQD